MTLNVEDENECHTNLCLWEVEMLNKYYNYSYYRWLLIITYYFSHTKKIQKWRLGTLYITMIPNFWVLACAKKKKKKIGGWGELRTESSIFADVFIFMLLFYLNILRKFYFDKKFGVEVEDGLWPQPLTLILKIMDIFISNCSNCCSEIGNPGKRLLSSLRWHLWTRVIKIGKMDICSSYWNWQPWTTFTLHWDGIPGQRLI